MEEEFEQWCKEKIADYRDEIDSEIIVTLDDLRSLFLAGYEAGKAAQRKRDVEIAKQIVAYTTFHERIDIAAAIERD